MLLKIISSYYWGAHAFEKGVNFFENNTFEKRVHISEKGCSHLLKNIILSSYFWGFTLSRGGFQSNNYMLCNYLICLKQNLIPTINVLSSHLTCGQLATTRKQ